MRPGSKTWLGLGALFLGAALVVGKVVLAPIPMDVVIVDDVGDPAGDRAWRIRAECPQRVGVGQTAPCRLEVRTVPEASPGGGLLVASLMAPGVTLDPPGHQVAPGGADPDFSWQLRADAPGDLEVTMELATRTEGISDRVLWVHPFDLSVVAVLGMNAQGLTAAAIAMAGLGAVSAVAGLWRGQRGGS